MLRYRDRVRLLDPSAGTIWYNYFILHTISGKVHTEGKIKKESSL